MGEMIIDNAMITILLTAESYQIHIAFVTAFRLSSDICKILPWCLGVIGITLPYPDRVYTPAWSVHSKATLLPLPPECTLQPHSEYYRCTLGCHSMD